MSYASDSPEKKQEDDAQNKINQPPLDAKGGNDGAFENLYGYSDLTLHAVRHALDQGGEQHDIQGLIKQLHAADMADLIEHLDRDERPKLLGLLGDELDPEALSDMDYSLRIEILKGLQPKQLARIITDLDSDDAIDIIEDLDESEQEALLKHVSAKDRAVYREALSFGEDSAGRLMRREVVTIPNFWTVGQTIDYLRVAADETLPDDYHSLIVTGPNHKPLGLLSLAKLLSNPRVTAIAHLMNKEPKLIPVDMDQEDVAFLFRQYALIEAPVIDEAGRLVGSITIDDIVDVIHEEHEEDMLSMAGVKADDFYADVMKTTWSRFTWLLINLFTAIAASLVIGLFTDTLEKLVALAVLMPIVASMGGNAGTQTLTVAVRAIATNELTPGNAWSIIVKETIVGGLNGLIFALLMGLIAAGWFSDPLLGMVIAAAMIINLLVAGMAGVMIPFTLNRLGKDPAISSAVFLTTVTDIIGFFAFLGLGSVVLVIS